MRLHTGVPAVRRVSAGGPQHAASRCIALQRIPRFPARRITGILMCPFFPKTAATEGALSVFSHVHRYTCLPCALHGPSGTTAAKTTGSYAIAVWGGVATIAADGRNVSCPGCMPLRAVGYVTNFAWVRWRAKVPRTH